MKKFLVFFLITDGHGRIINAADKVVEANVFPQAKVLIDNILPSACDEAGIEHPGPLLITSITEITDHQEQAFNS
jgi:hypothetical protein